MAYTSKDVWDDYDDGGEEREIAKILGGETGEEGEPPNSTDTSPILPISASATSSVRFNDFPFEIRAQILEEFLPPRNSVLKTTLRSQQQTSLQLPMESSRALLPLLLVSKSLSADLIALILGRCLVFVNHDSFHNSLKLLEESSLLNSPLNGFGLACLRKVEFRWAPEMEWDAERVEKFCKLLMKATGLVELTLSIPATWWKAGVEDVWKGGLRKVLANAPHLSGIRLGTYQANTNCHAGWQSLNDSSQLCTYRDGDSQWFTGEDA